MVFNGFNKGGVGSYRQTRSRASLVPPLGMVAMGSGRQKTNTATPPNPLLLVGGETAGLTKGKASNMPVRRYLPAYKRKEKRHHA